MIKIPTITAKECWDVRRKLQLSQRPFAKIVGIGIASVTKYERGTATPEKTPLLIYKLLQTDPHLIKTMWEINAYKLTQNEYITTCELCANVWGKIKKRNNIHISLDAHLEHEHLGRIR